MEKGKIELTQKDAENTPAGGVVVGKRDGQTMIYDDASLGGYFVGKLHKDGGIKMVNKSTGQPLEVQGSEVIITAPAVNDQTKREFDGKMMTNREILSKINSDGGGVSFADGGDIPAKIHTTDCEYKFGGKVVKDIDIAHSLGMKSTLKKGKQQFSSGDITYDVDAIYNAIKKDKLRLKTKEVETFPMKHSVYDKNYAENHKIDFRKPNGISVRTESGEEVLIDGNHRMNNAYLKGRKTMKTYYVEDPKQIAKFTKKNKFELGTENEKGGDLSSGKSLKQIAEMHNVSLGHINEQLAKGLEVEKEHFADFKERTRIAKDHLVENPNYYSILAKAGLKDGGHLNSHIKNEDLVKDAKDGNTPARDLNNYNDLMDVQADGEVGGESGIYADGGGIGLPKVAYVKVSNAGSSLYNKLVGNKYNSYIEFSESVEYAYKQLGKTVRSFVELEAFNEKDEKLLSASTYISDQKNTVKNFNPFTGNYKNLEKSLQNSRPRSFQKFDWEDWLLSKVEPSPNSSSSISSTNKSVNKDVQSVLVTYLDGQTYTALNEEYLLNKIVELWKNGGRSSMNIELQPQGFVTSLSDPITIFLDTISISKTSIQPSSLSLSELRVYLSKKWYPELDWSDFFKEVKNTVSNNENIVDVVRLEYQLDSKNYYEKTFRRGEDLLKDFYKIEEYCLKNPDTIISVIIIAEVTHNNGRITAKKERISIGEDAFKPRKFSYDEIKKLIEEEWFDNQLDFNNFFYQTTVSEKQKVSFLTASTDEATKNVRNVYEVKRFIEQNYASNGGSDGKLELYLNGDMTGGSWKITYGDGKKCSTCYDLFEGGTKRIKEILLSYAGADEFDWSDFFEEAETPTSNDVVPKTVEIVFSDLDEAVKKLEKASSKVATEYNKEIYDKSLKFLYDTKSTYELALKFTPESAFIYERLDILKKLADLEKNIKKIEDMKKGGTFYILAKILEKLQSGENWKVSEDAQDVITNKLPQSEIEVIIRSHKFKNWFGNWEKALINDEYDNVSKALTDGIPSVYHHGARRIKYTYREVSNGVLYLAENISYAIWFSQNSTAQSEEGNYLTDCFVNIKNPIDLTAFHVNQIDLADLVKYIDAIYPLAKIYNFIPAQVALLIKTNQPTNIKMWAWQLIRNYAKFVNHIKENTPYDGFLYYENNPSDQVINPKTGQLEENVTKAVAIFKSHQVKVVDAVLFDGGLDDWRFENGGKINN